MACRRRDSLILSNNSFTDMLFWLLFWFQFWPSSQSSRIFNLLLDFDEALFSGDRGRRGSPAVPFPLSPLPILLISETTQEETSLSRGILPIKSQICFTILLNLFRSGFASAPLETYKHRNSWTTRLLPFPTHQLNQLWLTLELLENSWWMEALGSSVKAPPPVKPQPPLAKTLVWLEVILLGLGPRHRQQSIGPINISLKTSSKNCGPTRKAFQLKSRTNIKAHLPITPNRLKVNPRKSDPIPNAYSLELRCVSFHQRPNLIFLIVQHPVSDGRRLQPCRVATWYISFVLIGPSEDLSLSKNFGNTQSPIRFNPSRTFSEWYRQLSNWSTKASSEESNHRISLTAGLYLGPLLASFPVRVSRMHGNSFFWMEISFIENFYRSCSSNFLPSLFSLMTVSVIENLSKFGSYNLLPRWFSLMICLLMDRSLCSYLESTSLNWLCEYLYQTLISNSSTTQPYPCRLFRTSLLHDLKGPWHPSALTKRTSALPSSYMERILPRSFIASLWLVPVSHEAKYPSLTSPIHMLIVTIPKIPELFAEVSSTHHDLVCGMLLDSLCFGVSMILSSKFVAYLSYLMYVLSLCSKTMYSLFLPFGIE